MGTGHRDLIREWLDGSLDDAGHERLQGLLRDRHAARDVLVEVHFDDALRRVAKAQADRHALEPSPAPALPPTQSPITTPTGRTRRHSSRWRLMRRPRTLPIAAAAGLLVAVLLGVAVMERLHQPQPIARLAVNLGGATLAGNTLAPGDERDLFAGAPLELPTRGWVTLRFPDGTTVEALGNTRLTADVGDTGKRLRLERGELRAEVRHQPVGAPLVVVTPRSDTTVVGTRLAVATGERERVAVDEGQVRVQRRSDRSMVEVAAGQQVEVPAVGALAVAAQKPAAPNAPPVDAPPLRALAMWLDADREVVVDEGGGVWQWRDRSGNGMHLSQGVPAFRPRLLTNPAGHAALSFDVGDDCLQTSADWPVFTSYTVAIALRPSVLGVWSQQLGCGWGMFTFHSEPSGGVYTGVGAPGGGIRFALEELGSGTLKTGSWQRFVVVVERGEGVVWRDGRVLARKRMPINEPWHGFHIGRLRPPPNEPSGFAGDLLEVLVYSRALDDDEVINLDRRLAVRVGMAP